MLFVVIIFLLFFAVGFYIGYRIKLKRLEEEYARAYAFRKSLHCKVGDDMYDPTGLIDFLTPNKP